MVKKPTCLDLEAFHSLDKDKRQAYLGVVDKLRELGVGEDLSLPQSVTNPAGNRRCLRV